MTGADLVVAALRHVGEPYDFGARVPKDAADWRGPWDCAEFASWVVYQVAGILYGVTGTDPATADAYSGRWFDDATRGGAAVDLGTAAAVAGAVLVRAPTDGAGVGHVAFSDGTGRTVEAHSRRRGVTRDQVAGRRWSLGVLVPGITFAVPPAPQPQPAEPRRVFRYRGYGAGAFDPFVSVIQRALARAGFAAGRVDGVYGPRTARAVAAFQQAEGLVADGEVGSATATALHVAPVAGGV